MKRRTVLRGIGAATTAAVGTAASATGMETAPDGGGATHVAIEEDGVVRVVPAENFDFGTEICPPPEDTDCCYACPCYPCHCERCL